MVNERATNGKDTQKADDPMAPFREVRDAYMDAWSKTMVDAVNSEAYAKTSGAVLDGYLTASSPFREALEKAMVQALQQLSMPSRADFISLADRMTNVEMKLDDMDAKLDHLQTYLQSSSTKTRRNQKRAAASPKKSERKRKGTK
jgi:Poly(R)-hydroxyalkanoic acid synthase subunit (PHA_synth_III_E).